MGREREYIAVMPDGELDREPWSEFEEMNALFARDGYGWHARYSEEFDYWEVIKWFDSEALSNRTYVRANARKQSPYSIDKMISEA